MAKIRAYDLVVCSCRNSPRMGVRGRRRSACRLPLLRSVAKLPRVRSRRCCTPPGRPRDDAGSVHASALPEGSRVRVKRRSRSDLHLGATSGSFVFSFEQGCTHRCSRRSRGYPADGVTVLVLLKAFEAEGAVGEGIALSVDGFPERSFTSPVRACSIFNSLTDQKACD
jgi:hypothetical protein